MSEDGYSVIVRTKKVPKEAAFAVRADSTMYPYFQDGERVYVSRDCRLTDGDVAVFTVSGNSVCRQYCEDSEGNIYLFCLNRDMKELDITVPHSDSYKLRCVGRVLMERPKLPD